MIISIETPAQTISDTFKRFLGTPNISVILINQNVKFFMFQSNSFIFLKKQIAETHLRPFINEYDGIIPTILEIPSKDLPYDPKKVIIFFTRNLLCNRIQSCKKPINYYMDQKSPIKI